MYSSESHDPIIRVGEQRGPIARAVHTINLGSPRQVHKKPIRDPSPTKVGLEAGRILRYCSMVPIAVPAWLG